MLNVGLKFSDCGWRGGFREEGNACVIYQDFVSLSENSAVR